MTLSEKYSMKFQSITLTIQHTCNIKNVKIFKILYSLFHCYDRQGGSLPKYVINVTKTK